MLEQVTTSLRRGQARPDLFRRPIYAGNAFATVRSSDSIKVLTIRATGFDAALIGKALVALAILFVVTQTATIWAFRRLTA